jgi:16S rRNA G966 N2-methylase RsmD
MRSIYAISFTAGMEGEGMAALKSALPDCEVLETAGNFIMFSCASIQIHKLNFCSSVYKVLHFSRDQWSLDAYAKALALRDFHIPKGTGTFNLRSFTKNLPSEIPELTRKSIISLIQSKSGLHFSTNEPDKNIHLQLKNTGLAFLALQIKAKKSPKSAGQLHADFCNLIIQNNLPQIQNGVVIDAFAGHGGFSQALIDEKSVQAQKLVLIESSPKLAQILTDKFGGQKALQIIPTDISTLMESKLQADFIFADPPPGGKGKKKGIQASYNIWLNALAHVLKPSGRLVIISSAKQELIDAINTSKLLIADTERNVLISGKKVLLISATKTLVH